MVERQVNTMVHGRYIAERNGEVWRAYCAGETPASIAARFDISLSTVQNITKKIREAIPEPNKDEMRLNALEMLHQLQAQIATIAIAEAPAAFTVTGKPLFDPTTGEVVKDYRQKFQAVELVLKTSERIAKILGLDAPLTTTVVIDQVARDAALSEAEAALAARPQLKILKPLELETG